VDSLNEPALSPGDDGVADFADGSRAFMANLSQALNRVIQQLSVSRIRDEWAETGPASIDRQFQMEVGKVNAVKKVEFAVNR
jgi:hypothetical protein